MSRRAVKSKPQILYRWEKLHPRDFRSHIEYEFASLWMELYPDVDLYHEYRFCLGRRFTIDFCHLPTLLGVELQGGIYVSGLGHSSGVGIQRDCEKAQLAASLGWLIIPLSADDINETGLAKVMKAIQVREEG